MNADILKKVESAMYKKRPDVHEGDTVKLHMKIKEGGKERIQVFEGVVIAMSGTGLSKTITVRKMSYGVGVERIVPLHAPTVEKIDVVKRGTVRRSKLYYMRDKIGKRALDVTNAENVYLTDTVEEAVEEKKEEVATETVAEEVKDEVEEVKQTAEEQKGEEAVPEESKEEVKTEPQSVAEEQPVEVEKPAEEK